MNKKQAFSKLQLIDQQHLLIHYDSLDEKQQNLLLDQIERIHIPTFRRQQQLLVDSPHGEIRLLDPITDTVFTDHGKWTESGKKLISEGKVGCLVIAGGQGTRLRYEGPKGCYPVSVIKNKSLFQLLAEKTLAASNQASIPLPLAVMTSSQNHKQTLNLFKEHNYFGLNPNQVSFFKQGTLPLLNHDENLFLKKTYQISEGPDGNGSSFHHFYSSGVWDQWYKKGVRLVNTVLIDNPLADPFDAELIGFHHDENADVIIKCTARLDPNEKVGILAKHADRIEIVEYTELPEKERYATDKLGNLLYHLANLSLFSFSMDFIKIAANKEIPLHLAHKAIKTLDAAAPEEPNAWKFETFIFDILQYALKIKTLAYPRENCFSPLKNREGPDSLETVQKSLQQRDCEVFKSISGVEAPNHPFELSQSFHYPTEAFISKWKDQPLPEQSYIE